MTMLSYKDFTNFFGCDLYNQDFQSFLASHFKDLSEYNILESEYITSGHFGIELGFTNNDAVYDDDTQEIFKPGTPLFTHFILYPESATLIQELPFNADFSNSRTDILQKTGPVTQTKKGVTALLNTAFLVDNYKVNDIVITFDYQTPSEKINFIQIRGNNLPEHPKL